MVKRFLAEPAWLGFNPRPGDRETEGRATQVLRQLDIVFVAMPKVGPAAAWHQLVLTLPDIPHIILKTIRVAGLTLMVRIGDAKHELIRYLLNNSG